MDVSIIDDYGDIERRLRQTQAEIGHALSNIVAAENLDYCNKASMDFLSIFTSSHDSSVDSAAVFQKSPPPPSVSRRLLTSAVDPEVEPQLSREPVRPSTLSRPFQVPSCCNFRRQPWHVYVHGDFSYQSTPRFYHGVDGEIGTATDNETLTRIIEELSCRRHEPVRGPVVASNDNTVEEPAEVDSDCVDDVSNDVCCCDESIDRRHAAVISGGENDDPTAETSRPDGNGQECSVAVEPLLTSTAVMVTEAAAIATGKRAPSVVSEQMFTLPRSENKESDILICDRVESLSSTLPSKLENICSLEIEKKSSTTARHRRHGVVSHCSSFGNLINREKRLSLTAVFVGISQDLAASLETGNKNEKEESTSSGKARRDLKLRRRRNHSLQGLEKTDAISDSSVLAERNDVTSSGHKARSITPSPALAERLDHRFIRATQTAENQSSSSGLEEESRESKSSSSFVEHLLSSPKIRKLRLASVLRRCRHKSDVDDDAINRRCRDCHVTSSLPAIDENELQPVDKQQRKGPVMALRRSSSGLHRNTLVSIVGQNLRSGLSSKENEVPGCQLSDGTEEHRRESLLDAMHKKYYPNQYQNGHNFQSSCCDGNSYVESLMHQTRSDVVTKMATTNVDHTLPQLELTRSLSTGSRNRGSEDVTDGLTSLEPSADDVNLPKDPVTESRLLEACRWLISAGLPQYVQLLTDNLLNDSCLDELSSEHQHLNLDWLQAISRRLHVLVRHASTKASLSEHFLRSLDAINSEQTNSAALSACWRYDQFCGRWRQSVPLSPNGVTESGSIVRRLSAAAVPTNYGCEASSLSPSLADLDTANHVTSGYESETTTNDRLTMTSSSDASPLTSSLNDPDDSSLMCRRNSQLTPTANLPIDAVMVRRRSARVNPVPRSLSFYDNLLQSEAVLADPQTELETILDDLRRNITALDAALAATTEELSPIASSSNSSYSFGSISPCNGNTGQSFSSKDGVEGVINGGTGTTVGCSLSDIGECSNYKQRNESLLMMAVKSYKRDTSVVGKLSASEMSVARQLAVIHLTSLFDRHCNQMTQPVVKILIRCLSFHAPNWNANDTKRVFGATLESQLRRSGRPLPDCIVQAMNGVKMHAEDTEGLFRKPGILSRVQKLQDAMETQADAAMRELDIQSDVYNLADVIKRYFRDLQESVLTDGVSTVLAAVFDYIPEEFQQNCLQCCMLLLPDANRIAVVQLMSFLHTIASHSDKNQMTASNLAVCFLPSLFRNTEYIQQTSPQVNSLRSSEEYQPNYKAALSCTVSMIQHSDDLSRIPDEISYVLQQIIRSPDCLQLRSIPTNNNKSSSSDQPDAVGVDVYVHHLIDQLNILLQSDSNHWISDPANSRDDVTVSRQLWTVDAQSTTDLLTWRCTVDIEAPPGEVLNRLATAEYSEWDSDVAQWRLCRRCNSSTDVVEFILNGVEMDTPRRICLLRSWQTTAAASSGGRCILVSTSVMNSAGGSTSCTQLHDDCMTSSPVTATVLLCHYVIEPCGTGMSRLSYFSSIDLRGQTSDWYKAVYGRLCARHVSRLRDSFRHDVTVTWSQGPETKV